MSRLMLLDSASMYFRAFHGVPDSITSPRGEPVNAVRGFLDMIGALVALRGPSRLVACWDDDWRPAFRVAALPSYKAHRVAEPGSDAEQVPDALEAQVPVIVELLEAFGIARLGGPGLEADDVIATLATRDVAAGPGDVDVVTGDRDLFQLVDDAAGIRVLYLGRGLRNLAVVDQRWLQDKYRIGSGAAYADLAILRGDPSDGLPGVSGIGEKTAATLLERFGDLDSLLAALDRGESGLPPAARRLAGAREYLAAAATVVQAVRDAPLPAPADAVPATPADPQRLAALAERWGVTGSVERLTAALAAATGAGTVTGTG